MQQLAICQLNSLSANLARLPEEGSVSLRRLFPLFTEIQEALDALVKGEVIPVESSLEDAVALLDRINALFDRNFVDPVTRQVSTPTDESSLLDAHDVVRLSSLARRFERSFAADLARLTILIPARRGIYSANDLMTAARIALPEILRKILPEAAMVEFDLAGRALSFGLATATGTHLLRGLEMILRQWAELFMTSSATRGERTWSVYLKRLATLADDENASARPDKRLVQLLSHIREQYRTPLMTPDNSLTIEQATAFFALASAAASIMGEALLSPPVASPSVAGSANSSAAKSANSSGKDGSSRSARTLVSVDDLDDSQENESLSLPLARTA